MMTEKFIDERVSDIMESLEFHYQILHEMQMIKEKNHELYEAEFEAIVSNLYSNLVLEKSRIKMEKKRYETK